ncbi:hypothetical protein [Mycobacterium avium]|nr:hypothetical protein [Mycobacterium avium]
MTDAEHCGHPDVAEDHHGTGYHCHRREDRQLDFDPFVQTFVELLSED